MLGARDGRDPIELLSEYIDGLFQAVIVGRGADPDPLVLAGGMALLESSVQKIEYLVSLIDAQHWNEIATTADASKQCETAQALTLLMVITNGVRARALWRKVRGSQEDLAWLNSRVSAACTAFASKMWDATEPQYGYWWEAFINASLDNVAMRIPPDADKSDFPF